MHLSFKFVMCLWIVLGLQPSFAGESNGMSGAFRRISFGLSEDMFHGCIDEVSDQFEAFIHKVNLGAAQDKPLKLPTDRVTFSCSMALPETFYYPNLVAETQVSLIAGDRTKAPFLDFQGFLMARDEGFFLNVSVGTIDRDTFHLDIDSVSAFVQDLLAVGIARKMEAEYFVFFGSPRS